VTGTSALQCPHRGCGKRCGVASRRGRNVTVDYSTRAAWAAGDHEQVIDLDDPQAFAEWTCRYCRQPVRLPLGKARRVGSTRRLVCDTLSAQK
jgi:hypothetical protein